MTFYALATTRLITTLQIKSPNENQVWLSDDVTDADTLRNLREWWDTVIEQGSNPGCFVNQKKSWLVLKSCLEEQR